MSAPTSEQPSRSVSLSPIQRRLLSSQLRSPDAPVQNMAILTNFEGPIDAARLAAAFHDVVTTSDALRTVVAGSDLTEAIIEPTARSESAIIELERNRLAEWAAERARQPLDLTTSVYDSVIVTHDDDTTSWFLNVHHMATDATSVARTIQATAAAYQGAEPGITSYYAWFDAAVADTDTAATFWQERRPLPRLARLYGLRSGSSPTSRRRPIELPDHVANSVRDRLAGDYRSISDELAATGLLLTATALFTSKLSCQTEFSVGLPVHNRRSLESHDVLGPVMDLYPVDVVIEPNDTVRSLHRRLSRSLTRTLQNARPGVSPDPDFDIVLNVIPGLDVPSFGDIPVTMSWLPTGVIDSDHLLRVQLTSYASNTPDSDGTFAGSSLHLDVSASATPDFVGERIDQHFVQVLDFVSADPDAAIDRLQLATDADLADLATWGEQPEPAASADLVDRLRSALEGNIDTVVTDGDDRISGDELWRWANAFAAELAGHRRVSIEVGPSVQAVVAAYAALIAGIPFVPIDATNPPGRRDRLCELGAVSLRVDRPEVVDAHRGGDPEASTPPAGTPADEAYVIFTSGSTGEPKGVPITRAGLSSYIDFAVDSYFDESAPVAPLFGSLGFDLTLTTLFAPIVSGGSLHVIGSTGPDAIAEIAGNNALTWCKATPSHLELLVSLAAETSMTTFVVGGEAFGTRLAKRLRSASPSARIFNEYGPTEAVVGCMIHELTDDDLNRPDVPIGIPAPGVALRIVDADDRPVPVGACGELLIGHPGITTGYLHADAAAPQPFVEIEGMRYYRSGDLVQLDDRGLLIYRGRIDAQLKVGGIRLDPVEVEAALLDHPDIASAAVRLWAPSPTPPMQRCTICGLADNVPGTTFDDDGVCNTCHSFATVKETTASWFGTPDDLVEILDRARKRGTGDYDCLALLSGGKDSTYALYALVEQGYRPYAFTLDNGFISEGAKANIQQVAEALDIPYEFATTPEMNEIFQDSLATYSNVCHGCYKTIYTLAINRADELGIPLISTGLSRGQLFETRLLPEQFRLDRFDPDEIDRTVIEARKRYHRSNDAVNRLLDTERFDDDALFDRIEFIDVYRYVDVELEEMLGFLDAETPWQRPADTGRSTNCLINVAGIYTHLHEQGYHNYAIPYAWDVRLGHKTRDESIAELEDEINLTEISELLTTVAYTPDPKAVLTAWVVPNTDAAAPNAAEVRDFLGDRLARHAIPTAVVGIDELPMTSNGKLDTEALPAPQRVHRAGAAALVPPMNDLERVTVAAAQSALGIEPISVDDDFFAIGGDSLAALNMVLDLESTLGYPIAPELAFVHSTPRALAEAIAATQTASTPVQLRSRAAVDPRSFADPERITPLAMGPGEASIVFEQRRRSEGSMYNLGRVFTVAGPVDLDRLATAIRDAATLHEPLRVSYATERKALDPEQAINVVVAGGFVAPDEAAAVLSPTHRAPFDLENGPIFRAAIQPVDDGTTAVLLTAHHAAVDLNGFGVLWGQIDALYRGEATSAPDVAYGDFLRWQQQHQPEEKREFWLERSQSIQPTGLALSGPRTAEPDDVLHLTSRVSPDSLRSLEGAPPPTIAVAAATAALAPYFHNGIVETNLVSSTRTHPVADRLVGYLLNPIPTQLRPESKSAITDLLRPINEAIGAALPWRDYPIADRVADARTFGIDPNPVNVLVSVDAQAVTELDGTRVEQRALFNGTAVGDLAFFIEARSDRVDLSVEYSGQTIGRIHAERIAERFRRALEAIVDHDPITVGDLTDPADASLLVGPDLELDTLILDRIAPWGSDRPSQAAAECGDEILTWAELDSRSASLAARLNRAGVGKGDRVAVRLPRSTSLIVAVMGVLRSGAVYTPIDPSYPDARVDLMTTAAGATLSIVAPGDPLSSAGQHITIDAAGIDGVAWSEASSEAPAIAIDPDDPAYVIFTSGSTGVPAGVEVTHRQLSASTNARAQFYPQAARRFGLFSSISFDSSIVGLFWTLASGGTIVLPIESQAHDIDALAHFAADRKLSHILCVPTLYSAMLRRRPSGTGWPAHVIVAGESCPVELVQSHHREAPNSALTNEYGPTEATVWATAHACVASDDPVPIGRPIAGSWAAVVDADGAAAPRGVVGELVLGGAGITAGYFNDAQRTSERFASAHNIAGAPSGPIFRTGDLVRVDDDTNLVFLGRRDTQLSVGGVRVEPEEIEDALASVPGVTASVASVRTSDDETMLAAFVECLPEHFDADALRRRCRERLPAPAIPRVFSRVDELPRMPNGKVDRAAAESLPIDQVPSPAASDASSDPATETILEIFRTQLRQPDMGPHDSLFDQGGNSLVAIEVLEKIERAFDIELSTSMLFDHPTAHGFAHALPTDARRAGTGADSAQRRLRSLVIPIRREGADTPIFAVHHLGIDASLFRPIAEAITGDHPFYGLAAPLPLEPWRKADYDTSIDYNVASIADSYLREIESLAPDGPVIIAGTCQGALFAYEVASQLRQRGRAVDALIMLTDWHAPHIEYSDSERVLLKKKFEHLRVDGVRGGLRKLVSTRGPRLRAQRQAEILALRAAKRLNVDLPHALRVRDYIERSLVQFNDYEYDPYDGYALVVRGSDDERIAQADRTSGWGDLIANLDIEFVPGWGTTILLPPHLEHTAAAISAALERSQGS